MKRTSGAQYLMEFAKELRSRQALPQNIELSTIGPVVMASVFDKATAVITDEVTTGMDIDPDVAVLKGLVERIERSAFVDGRAKHIAACFTGSSDGFAAFPQIFHNSKEHARNNAFHEAIERFVWATWWDNKNIAHDSQVVDFQLVNSPSQKILRELSSIIPLKSVNRILPRINNNKNIQVVVYFAFLESVGVVSGGAAGPSEDLEVTNFRAVCELVRHGLAMKKIREENIKTETFYENRLVYFGSTEGGTVQALERLNCKGIKGVDLPELKFDEVIPHSLSDLVNVHRCYFKDQPAFIGGSLERLCL